MTTARADTREFCPAANRRTGWRCDFAAHPWQTHWTWVGGELKVWSAPTPTWTNKPLNAEDPLRDAPERLRRPDPESLPGHDTESGAYEVGSPAHQALERRRQDALAEGTGPEGGR